MTNKLLNVRLILLLLLGCGLVATIACASKPTTTSSTNKSSSASKPAPRPVGTASTAPKLEDDILILINQHRRSKGLPALTNNLVIETEARRHSMAMATKRIPFGHEGFNIRSKIVTSKVPGTNAVAENVALGSNTAKEVVDGWLNSPGHKKNIEGNYKLTGIGVARDQQAKLYFTQIFAR
jgi:uncharacterized protein YkwD